jgi:hypothetical protein
MRPCEVVDKLGQSHIVKAHRFNVEDTSLTLFDSSGRVVAFFNDPISFKVLDSNDQ